MSSGSDSGVEVKALKTHKKTVRAYKMGKWIWSIVEAVSMSDSFLKHAVGLQGISRNQFPSLHAEQSQNTTLSFQVPLHL